VWIGREKVSHESIVLKAPIKRALGLRVMLVSTALGVDDGLIGIVSFLL